MTLSLRAESFVRLGCSVSRQSTRTFFSLPFSNPNPPPKHSKGSLKKHGSISVYTEGRRLNYSPKELYSVIADVDSYHSFLPFATASTVLSAAVKRLDDQPREKRPVEEKEWLKQDQGGIGEEWEMEAELKVGAMGFDEGYVSIVEAKKWQSVSAKARDSTMFKHLHTSWTLTPIPPSTTPKQLDLATATQVDLYLAYSFASPLHALVVSQAWESVSRLMIDGFEKRLGVVYGKR